MSQILIITLITGSSVMTSFIACISTTWVALEVDLETTLSPLTEIEEGVISSMQSQDGKISQ